MKVLETSVIYENPLPQLRSRQAAFPNLCQLPDGTILADFVIGEAFESVDGASYLSRSTDGGKTWSVPKKMFNAKQFDRPISEASKPDSWETSMECFNAFCP